MTPDTGHLGGQHRLRAALRWVLVSWWHPADATANWEQRAGHRLALGQLDAGPRNPSAGTHATANPAQNAAHGTPTGH